MSFITSSGTKNAYFMSAEPRMNLHFLTSQDEINYIFIPKNEFSFYNISSQITSY